MCIGLNVKLRSQLSVPFNTILYGTFNEFYIKGLKLNMLCQNTWPE
jgi:hypothetical protein